jgi:hypothetical protein
MLAICSPCFCKGKFTFDASTYLVLLINVINHCFIFICTSYDVLDSDIDQSVCGPKIPSRFSRLLFCVFCLSMKVVVIYQKKNTTRLTSIYNFTSFISFPMIIWVNVPCILSSCCTVFNKPCKLHFDCAKFTLPI